MKKIIFIAIAALIALSANATDLEKVEKATTQCNLPNGCSYVDIILRSLPSRFSNCWKENSIEYLSTSGRWQKVELIPNQYVSIQVPNVSKYDIGNLILNLYMGAPGVVIVNGERFYPLDYIYHTQYFSINPEFKTEQMLRNEIEIWIE